MYRVSTPLGNVDIELERGNLALEERGGFEACWASENGDCEVLTLESFRQIVKEHLGTSYQKRHGKDPRNIPLNLVSHQLIDDLIGWTKLNYKNKDKRT